MAGVSCRCCECGFLAVIHRQTRNKMEADSDVRNSGYLLTEDPATRQTVYERYPICFVHAINMMSDLGRTPTEEQVKDYLKQTRRCDKYEQWRPGNNPKEHQEMLQERERLDWQAKREDGRRLHVPGYAQGVEERERFGWRSSRSKRTEEEHGRQPSVTRRHLQIRISYGRHLTGPNREGESSRLF